MADWQRTHALIVVDVQQGFDEPCWGRRNNPACESNIVALVAAWRERQWPVVFVRHDSRNPTAPLSPAGPGNALKAVLGGEPDLLVAKQTNSAFYGTPDLHAWLQQRGLDAVSICGITTNHCCETTARMAGNLGYETKFVIDATHTFDRQDLGGEWVSADELTRITAANLNGEFATVLATGQVLAALTPGRDGPRRLGRTDR
ncbi:MAG: cysteine hydrolase [Actinomycetota bacterium]|nr:cysteine hydrolase [Actinomycetota bacterium]